MADESLIGKDLGTMTFPVDRSMPAAFIAALLANTMCPS